MADITPYLKKMGRPLLGFAAGYMFLIVWFVGFFAFLYRLDQGAFTNVPARRSFWDFLYFSAVTFPPLGYTDIRPHSFLAQVFISLESIAGFVWSVVVFAAILAYLGPIFKKVSQERGQLPHG